MQASAVLVGLAGRADQHPEAGRVDERDPVQVHGLGVLVAGRLVQGAAAAVMMPSSMALVGRAFADPARRARAVVLWAMGGAAASSAGPVTGGLLTLASWRRVAMSSLNFCAIGGSPLAARDRVCRRADYPAS